jgi:Domain of unknown function (DUF4332)
MTNLSSILGITQSSLELLEAAGFSDAESLAKAGLDELTKELARANQMLQITEHAPARDLVAKWIAVACELTGRAQNTDTAVTMPVNYEISPPVAAMLANAPFAIPLPAKVLVDRHLSVSDIPPAIFLNRYSGDLEVRVEDRVPMAKGPRPAMQSGNVRIAETSGTRMDIDASRIKSTDILAGAAPRRITADSAPKDDRVALIRGPRVETNKGRDPQSRRFIRGVLHSHPVSLGFGAVVTLFLAFLLPTAIISAGLLLLSDLLPLSFGWVSKWLIVFPAALPVVGVAWLIWGMNGSCRICGQKMFVPRMCLKNSKAHYVRGLGYIIPTAVQMLLFRWFRCIYCGTPVRLKK